MPGESGGQESSVHGSGQAVTISVGTTPTIILCVFLAVVLGMLFLSTRSSAKAELRAEAAEKAAMAMAGELRLAQAWMQASYNAQMMNGGKPPPIPATFMKK